MRVPLLWILVAVTALAIPKDLIVLADGKTVYFRTRTGIVTDSWFRLTRVPDGGVTVVPARASLSDVNETGTMEAASTFRARRPAERRAAHVFLRHRAPGALRWRPPGIPD